MPAPKFSRFQIDSGFWYLATPYSKYHLGRAEAFAEAARIAAGLLRAGVPVFSPIVHTHPIAEHGGIDPFDHAIWMPVDRPFMELAHGLIVAKMPGWFDSHGIRLEVDIFKLHGKPIEYLELPL